jgi:hypothetical protein
MTRKWHSAASFFDVSQLVSIAAKENTQPTILDEVI